MDRYRLRTLRFHEFFFFLINILFMFDRGKIARVPAIVRIAETIFHELLQRSWKKTIVFVYIS